MNAGVNRMMTTHDKGDTTVCTYCTLYVHMDLHNRGGTH